MHQELKHLILFYAINIRLKLCNFDYDISIFVGGNERKKCKKYLFDSFRKESLLNIKEDYHIHCNYNDHSSNDLTVGNIFKRAKDLNLQAIALTEHVRKTSEWTERYLEDIKLNESNVNFNVLKGFEAKILADGNIDCPDLYLNNKYFIIASFHTKYKNKTQWYNALIKAIQNENVNVIGHLAPEPEFSLTFQEIKRLGEEIASNDKIIEINAKYIRPPLEFIKTFIELEIKFHLGSDAHSLNEVGNFDRIKYLINFIEQCKA
jgi:histidinol phosphatase-like PHP family hydrolase